VQGPGYLFLIICLYIIDYEIDGDWTIILRIFKSLNNGNILGLSAYTGSHDGLELQFILISVIFIATQFVKHAILLG